MRGERARPFPVCSPGKSYERIEKGRGEGVEGGGGWKLKCQPESTDWGLFSTLDKGDCNHLARMDSLATRVPLAHNELESKEPDLILTSSRRPL